MSGHDLGSSASSGAIWPEDTINSFETGQSLTQHARSSTSYNNIKKKKSISSCWQYHLICPWWGFLAIAHVPRLLEVYWWSLFIVWFQLCSTKEYKYNAFTYLSGAYGMLSFLLTRCFFFLFEVNKIFQDLNIKMSFFFWWKVHPYSQPLFSFFLGEHSPSDIEICFPWRNVPDHANNMKNHCEFVSRNICSRVSTSLKSKARVKARTLKINCLFH